MMSCSNPDPARPKRPPRPPGAGPRRVKVCDLLDGDKEAILEHAGQDYRLRITSNGKLILTK